MKTFGLTILTILCTALCHADVVSDTRQALCQVTGKLDMRRNWTSVYWNYGIRCSTNAEYRALATTVSNQWRSVLANLPRCATNQLERLLVLGVRDQFGEDFFYDYVDGVLDLWRTGAVSKAELQWINHSDKPGLYCLFERRYRDERARRLVLKFQEAEPDNDFWGRVLSGEAYTNYLEFVQEGMISPE